MKRITTTRPLKQGRYWWKEPQNSYSKLVYIEQQSLGLYILGHGWLVWQTGNWSPRVGESQVQNN